MTDDQVRIVRLAKKYEKIKGQYGEFLKNIRKSFKELNLLSDTEVFKEIDKTDTEFRFKYIDVPFLIKLSFDKNEDYGEISFGDLILVNGTEQFNSIAESICIDGNGNLIPKGKQGVGQNVKESVEVENIFNKWMVKYIGDSELENS